MRICSLLPSATEMLFALGLDDEIVGVSHECDFPPAALHRPKVVHTVVHQDTLSSLEIDRAVRVSVDERQSLYEIDEEALRRAAPDLIVTQELCDVCAVDTSVVAKALRVLPERPETISLHPHTLSDVLADLSRLGRVTGREVQARTLVERLRERIERVRKLVEGAARPRVFCLEWLAPPMASGHWVPELVELAGGQEVLGRVNENSRYVSWQEIANARPEVVVLMPCGFPIQRIRRELSLVTGQPLWKDLPAVRAGQVFLVDGPAYFNRSGPRLIDGIEILAGLIHPQRCRELIPPGTAEPL